MKIDGIESPAVRRTTRLYSKNNKVDITSTEFDVLLAHKLKGWPVPPFILGV